MNIFILQLQIMFAAAWNFSLAMGGALCRRGRGYRRVTAPSTAACAVGIRGWVLLGFGLGWSALEMVHAAEPEPGYEAFRLVQTRNVFDPDRRVSRPQGAVRETAAPARVDSIALTGTMVEPGRALAFFGGSRPEFRQVVSLDGEIAGYTLVGVTTTHIELEREGERLRLAVGQGLRREGDGAWAQAGQVARPSPAAASTATARPEGGGSSDGALSDLMKRMMQRRQQEVSR
jgi:hypothetical protein